MFIPEGYELPSPESQFMKLEQGENKVRVLSDAIMGTEWWSEDDDGSPVVHRIKMGEKAPIAEMDKREKDSIKHFWAFVVWNYRKEMVQVLVITQATIQKQIKAYYDNEKWGDPKQYDLVITRTGESLKTEYSVVADPKETLNDHIKNSYEMVDVDLTALYRNEFPFTDGEEVTMEDVERSENEK